MQHSAFMYVFISFFIFTIYTISYSLMQVSGLRRTEQQDPPNDRRDRGNTENRLYKDITLPTPANGSRPSAQRAKNHSRHMNMANHLCNQCNWSGLTKVLKLDSDPTLPGEEELGREERKQLEVVVKTQAGRKWFGLLETPAGQYDNLLWHKGKSKQKQKSNKGVRW